MQVLDHFLLGRITELQLACFLPSPFAHRRQEDGLQAKARSWWQCTICGALRAFGCHDGRGISREAFWCSQGRCRLCYPVGSNHQSLSRRGVGAARSWCWETCGLTIFGTMLCTKPPNSLGLQCRNLEGHEMMPIHSKSHNYMITVYEIHEKRYDDMYIYESMYIWKYMLYNHMFPTRKYMYKNACMYVNDKKTHIIGILYGPPFFSFLSFSRERLPFQNQLAFEQTAVIGNPKFERFFQFERQLLSFDCSGWWIRVL